MFSALVFAALAVLLVLNVILLLRPVLDNGSGMLLHAQEAAESRLREELTRLRQEIATGMHQYAAANDQRSHALRSEVASQLTAFRGSLDLFGAHSREHTDSVLAKFDAIRTSVDQRLLAMQTGNEKKLDQMRQTVDEKLQGTLETRLGESFKLVSERLEQVQRGLGEMQALATGVGDLKRVLSNVTTRGAWGEVQLESILQQILAPEQYERNVCTTGTTERVEFAIRLPGQNEGRDVWLPIDAKFPMEAYQRLASAAELGDAAGVEVCAKELEGVIRTCAKTFTKYLCPPNTTDFGILFLATEGLYAEALRRPALVESLQRDHRVVLAGPTTFAAILNSLQMGFRTLTIQKRSSEVWQVLGEVKSEFGRYLDVLGKVKKKLEEANNQIGQAEVRTRAIEKKLRNVESAEDLPLASTTLHLIAANGDVD